MLRLRQFRPRRALVALFASATLLLTTCDVSIACDPVQAEFHAPGHSEFVAAPHSTSRLLLLQGQRSLLRVLPFQAALLLGEPALRIASVPLPASHLRLLAPSRHHSAGRGRTDDPPA